MVAVPEGLPLAVTLALAFATTRMLKENNLVRVLRACETMGNATTVCSDKTGTLTTNKMTVVTGTFGHSQFDKADSGEATKKVSQWAAELSQPAKDLIVKSVAINSTAFEGLDEGKFAFIGSKTETALLQLARDYLGMQSLPQARSNEQIVQMFPFDSGKKCMGAVIKHGNGYRLMVKGASEILLGMCSFQANIKDLSVTPMNQDEKKALTSTINSYARQSLRTIGLIYCDYEQWPPQNATIEGDSVVFSSILKDLVFLGVVGIQDPVRPGVPESVKKAQHAGVVIRMVTGDNAVTARAIATECGILTEGGVVMEGPTFRRLSDEERDRVLLKLQVLARSSPEDKRILVTRLKHLGETVAVTGDGTNDAPALKAADVGFSMGISGTEVAKEASAIILMDDNFTSIIMALKWGRAVNDAVQKFLQVCLHKFGSRSDNMCANIYTVPNYCQHHRRPAGFHLCRLRCRDAICAYSRSAPVGQPHHGHVCSSRARHRSANRKDPQSPTARKAGTSDYNKHVEDDHRPGHLSTSHHIGSVLCWHPHIHNLFGCRDAHNHLQHFCVDANLQRVQQQEAGQQVQHL